MKIKKQQQGIEITIFWNKPRGKIFQNFFGKRRKTIETGLQPVSRYLLYAFLILLLASTGIAYGWYQETKGYKPETLKTEVKKLPIEIKKQVALATPSATFRVPILLYHYVEYVKDTKDKERQSLDILPSIFEQQIVTLQNAGYTFITAGDVGDVLLGRKQLPEKPIILTFDDGHWDLDTDVLPILKKYHVKATAYIIPGFIGGSDFLTPEQLQDVAKSGLVELGAHTMHHLWLAKLPLATVDIEVTQSKTVLEQMIHMPVVSFAYPFGAFDDQAVQVVKNAGFTNAVSTVPGIEVNQANKYFMYRIRPGVRAGQQLLDYLSQDTFVAW